ncbi:hypothetical protein I7I51_06963 [Histoplasma capsulatum]|uniref:Uncharacterized protein n=1 Tax=Ajellomyces capsulatus TaxID=5037 RepID=A0A8A1MNB0_AJECA|nr:hypothetical protein I7I51_06963 [Histoplasma capsulatum]
MLQRGHQNNEERSSNEERTQGKRHERKWKQKSEWHRGEYLWGTRGPEVSWGQLAGSESNEGGKTSTETVKSDVSIGVGDHTIDASTQIKAFFLPPLVWTWNWSRLSWTDPLRHLAHVENRPLLVVSERVMRQGSRKGFIAACGRRRNR